MHVWFVFLFRYLSRVIAMSCDNNRSDTIDTSTNEKIHQRDSTIIEDVSNKKIADFETAITAAEIGKFQYLLSLAIIPASWASSIDTSNMSVILASAECDLGLSLFDKGLLNSSIYFGMVLSGFVWGYIADVKGRKKVVLYGYLADSICNILAGFSQNMETLVFFKFLSGLLVSGPHATLMAYSSEFYGAKGRTKIPILVGLSVQFGCIINVLLAWFVIPQPWLITFWNGAFVYNSWRMFLSLCGIPTLIGVMCLSFFPESPKFLMTQNRNEDALEIFKKIYCMNTGLSKDNYPISIVGDVDLNNAKQSSDSENPKSCLKNGIQQMKPLFTNPYLPRILLIVTLQFCGMLCLNTFRLWQPQLFATIKDIGSRTNATNPTFCELLDISVSASANQIATSNGTANCENIPVPDSIYIDSVIVSTSSSFFILCSTIFVNFLQHKYLAMVSHGCAFLCVISLIWSPNSLSTLVLTCLYLGLLSKTYNILVGATVLLFPTSLRAMAVSLEMIVGRLGSIMGNFIFPVLLEYGCISPIINLSCFSGLCILLTCFLPSTRKHAV